MPNVKISALPAVTSVVAAQEFAVNDVLVSKKATAQQIKDYVLPDLSITTAKIADSAVTQGKISTGLQQSSGSSGGTIPYGFALSGGTWSLAFTWSVNAVYLNCVSNNVAGYSTTVYVSSGVDVTYLQSRYINASPPYNFGDGDIPIFCYLVVRPNGTVQAVDITEAPPWYYNGPRKINPYTCFHNASGVAHRRVRQIIAEHGNIRTAVASGLTRAQVLDRLVTDPFVDEELTMIVKMRDSIYIPHPFRNVPTNHTVVLLDPFGATAQRLLALHELQDPEMSAPKMLTEGLFAIGNTPLVRSGPPGVMVVNATLK